MLLRRAKYEPLAVASPKEAIAVVRVQSPSLILMDMNFSLTTSGDEGLTLLRQVKLLRPEVPVMLMTAWGSIQLAVKGMQAGAFDFVTKPWNNVALLQRIATALQISANSSALSPHEIPYRSTPEGQPDAVDIGFDRSFIIGHSQALEDVLLTIRRVSRTNASVLITGESGTGKELIAEALHCNSLRGDRPFVKVNLGGISQSLFESEMFGHLKGSFTDATSDRQGRFELADKGTIFLDEIGDLDIANQVKLLRVLQDQTYEVLGDSHPRQVDVRVVCATNADLPARIREHTFREDLFYRINLITVHLPALRERRDDIPLLASHFAHEQCVANHLPEVDLAPDALGYLSRQPFPGNVRQLKNLVERTLLVTGHTRLTAADFEQQAGQTPALSAVAPAPASAATLEEMERLAIKKVYQQCHGNMSAMARALGISRAALYRRIEKYGLF
jgi:two-component system NtrC family response regulator